MKMKNLFTLTALAVLMISSCLSLNAQGNLISMSYKMSEPRERIDGVSEMTQYTYMTRSMNSESEADTLIVLLY
jgi:hypothetical protein